MKLTGHKIGVIGLGCISQKTHLPLWASMKDKVEVTAICDVDQKKLLQASNTFGIHKTYQNPIEMLESESLDLVDVCTPPLSHTSLCLAALNAGVNCMVEKPPTVTLKDFKALRQSASSKGAHLFVIHNYSYVPVIRKARELLCKGEIGEIFQVNVQLSATMDPEYKNPQFWAHNLPGGLFGETAPHPCYLLSEFLPGDIIEVKSQTLRRSNYPFLAGDELRVSVQTTKALGSFSISFNSPLGDSS